MKDKTKTIMSSRRTFLKTSLGAAAAAGFPTIVPSSVFGQLSPSNRINIGAIGVGRISRVHDLPGIWKYDQTNIMAVCDLDANRVELGKALINGYYSKKTGKPYDGVTGYHHYRELLANKDIDAVVISTSDHQHAILAVDAVRAKKDVYLQKPASLTISEGRHMSDQEIPPAAIPLRCLYRQASSTMPGSVQHPRSPTLSTASCPSKTSAAPAGSAWSSSAPA